MSPFVTFKDVDKTGELQYYILQRAFPHYVGIIKYKPNIDALIEVPVTNHNLWVSFAGTIRGNFMPSYPGWQKELEKTFLEMAIWFYQNRILKEPRRYKKWAIHPS